MGRPRGGSSLPARARTGGAGATRGARQAGPAAGPAAAGGWSAFTTFRLRSGFGGGAQPRSKIRARKLTAPAATSFRSSDSGGFTGSPRGTGGIRFGHGLPKFRIGHGRSQTDG